MSMPQKYAIINIILAGASIMLLILCCLGYMIINQQQIIHPVSESISVQKFINVDATAGIFLLLMAMGLLAGFASSSTESNYKFQIQSAMAFHAIFLLMLIIQKELSIGLQLISFVYYLTRGLRLVWDLDETSAVKNTQLQVEPS